MSNEQFRLIVLVLLAQILACVEKRAVLRFLWGTTVVLGLVAFWWSELR